MLVSISDQLIIAHRPNPAPFPLVNKALLEHQLGYWLRLLGHDHRKGPRELCVLCVLQSLQSSLSGPLQKNVLILGLNQVKQVSFLQDFLGAFGVLFLDDVNLHTKDFIRMTKLSSLDVCLPWTEPHWPHRPCYGLSRSSGDEGRAWPMSYPSLGNEEEGPEVPDCIVIHSSCCR